MPPLTAGMLHAVPSPKQKWPNEHDTRKHPRQRRKAARWVLAQLLKSSRPRSEVLVCGAFDLGGGCGNVQ